MTEHLKNTQSSNDRISLLKLLNYQSKDNLFLFIMFLISLAFFSTLSYFFYANDFFHLRTISYAEKARLAAEGLPPRLENIGFVYPPLPVFLCILIPKPWLAQGIISATTLIALMYLAIKFYRNFETPFFLLPVYLPFLFLSTFRFDILILFLLITLSTLLLIRFWETGFSLYLFIGGFLFGFTFFIDFSTIYLIPTYIPAILLRKGINFKEKLGISLVFLSPLVFFTAFALFINFTFKEDPFYFLRSYSVFYSQNIEVLQAKFSITSTISLFLKFLKLSFVLILPYLLGFFFINNWREFYLSPLIIIYVIPILFSLLQIKLGTFSPSISNTLLFTLFFLLFSNRLKSKRKTVALLSFIIALIMAPMFYLKSPDANERNFSRGILGMEFYRNLSLYRNLALELNKLNDTVLLDDKALYPAVLFVSNIKKLILPYQYEFYTILSNPKGRVGYIAGVENAQDEVYHFYPLLGTMNLDGCTYYGRLENVFLFSCR